MNVHVRAVGRRLEVRKGGGGEGLKTSIEDASYRQRALRAFAILPKMILLKLSETLFPAF